MAGVGIGGGGGGGGGGTLCHCLDTGRLKLYGLYFLGKRKSNSVLDRAHDAVTYCSTVLRLLGPTAG